MAVRSFEFATAGRILFGVGAIENIAALAAEYGRSALIVTGRSGRHGRDIEKRLGEAGIAARVLQGQGEPTTDDARRGVELARSFGAELVVGIGGGSALDLGKAVAALLTNGGDPLDYLEVIGQGKKIEREPAPYIAIPTTSGTGSEVTRNAVLESPEHRVKVSLRSQLMLPKLALVDPRLCVSVPPEVTASTGFDALAQVIEPYVSNRRNPMTDALCLEAIGRGARSLLRAYRNGEDLDAREDMAIASLFGGLALANAKLGAVHGFAGPLGGMYGAPHGALCAALLPGVMAVNVAALQKRDPDSEVLERYATVARLLTDNANAQPEDAAVWARETAEKLRIPKLSEYGVKQDALREITNKAAGASSMQGNPIVLTEEELEKVVRSAL